jgi:hypothetical protein
MEKFEEKMKERGIAPIIEDLERATEEVMLRNSGSNRRQLDRKSSYRLSVMLNCYMNGNVLELEDYLSSLDSVQNTFTSEEMNRMFAEAISLHRSNSSKDL